MHVSHTHYNTRGQVDFTTDALGRTTRFEYDDLGNVTRTTLPDADDDPQDPLTWLNNPFTEAFYDSLGRKQYERELRLPGEPIVETSFEYNAIGLLSAVIQPPVPDPQAPTPGTLVRPRWEYEYWPSGELKTVRDPLGRETDQAFDSLGHRTLRQLPALPGQPAGDAEHWSYDTLGRQETHQDAAGNVTRFHYDTLGRAEEEFYYSPGESTPAATVHRAYDALSRLESVADSAYGLTSYEYDTAGRTTLVASPEGVLHYEFDPATGRLTRTFATADTSPESAITSDVRYAYDPFGRLFTVTAVVQLGITLAVPEVTTYGYDAAGELVQATMPNGVISSYGYDSEGRLERLTNRAADDTPGDLTDNLVLSAFVYTRGAGGRIVHVDESVRQPDAGTTTAAIDYVFDNLGRLTHEQRDSSVNADDYAIDYVLDLVGNRLRKITARGGTVERVEAQFNARDQLFDESGQTASGTAGPWSPLYETTYGYDAQGNQRSKSRTGTLPETTVYGFDVRNRLTSMSSMRTLGSGELGSGDVEHFAASYGYDSQGIRVSKRETRSLNSGAAETTATAYLIDAHNPTGYAQAIEERSTRTSGTTVTPPAASAVPSASFVFGVQLISQARAAAGQSQPVTSIYLQDAHSGVRQLVAMAAPAGAPAGTPPSVTDTYVYESFGTLLAAAHWSAGETPNEHRFRAEVFDSGLGFTYLRARYLDSTTARFTAQDPYEGDLAHPLTLPDYWYAAADGVNNIDPTGTFFGAILALAWNLARTGAAITVGSAIVGSIAGAGLYSYAFNASAIEGAEYGAQLGASFGAAYSLGGGGWKGTQNVGETAFYGGLFPGLVKWTLTFLDHHQTNQLDAFTATKQVKSFYEGFVSGVWSYTWSDFLDKRTSISNSTFGDLGASFLYTIGTQFSKEMLLTSWDQEGLAKVWGKLISETVPIWLANHFFDKFLERQGISDPSQRKLLAKALGASYSVNLVTIKNLF